MESCNGLDIPFIRMHFSGSYVARWPLRILLISLVYINVSFICNFRSVSPVPPRKLRSIFVNSFKLETCSGVSVFPDELSSGFDSGHEISRDNSGSSPAVDMVRVDISGDEDMIRM